MDTDRGRDNWGFDPSPGNKQNRDIVYIKVKALNALPDPTKIPLNAVLLPPSHQTTMPLSPQALPIQTQPYFGQQPQMQNTFTNNGKMSLNNEKSASQSSGKATSPSPETEVEVDIEEWHAQNRSKPLLIFVRILSMLLISYDVIQDWCQLTEIYEINEQTKDTLWSVENFTEYFRFPNQLIYESRPKHVFFKESYLNVSLFYEISTIFGTAFAFIRILNIIGETIKESKLDCCRGIQIIHGWSETFWSVLFEDFIQVGVLFVIVFSCERAQLGYVKILITLLFGFFKNLFRYLTCRQRRYPGCNSDISPSSYCHLCCGPQEPCSVHKQDCSYGIDCPGMCSCGRLLICGKINGESQCCTYSCFNCLDDKNYDPPCTKALVNVLLGVELIFCVHIVLSLCNVELWYPLKALDFCNNGSKNDLVHLEF